MKLSDAYASLELHVIDGNRDLPATLGKAIRAAGGSYSEMRSWADSRRFVKVPTTALHLVQSVFNRYEVDIVIMRRPSELFMDRTVPPTRRAFHSGQEVMVSGKAGREQMQKHRDAIILFLERQLAFTETPQAHEMQAANVQARRDAAVQATQDRLANERRARLNGQGDVLLGVLSELLDRIGGAEGELAALVQRGRAAVNAVHTPRETDLPLDALQRLP